MVPALLSSARSNSAGSAAETGLLSCGATRKPLFTGWLALGVVDVHPMRGIRQKVDARAVPVDSLHVVLSPHKRRALRAHKVHLEAEDIRAATTAAALTAPARLESIATRMANAQPNAP